MGMSEILTFSLFWCKVYKLVCPFVKVIFMSLNQMYFMLPEMYFVFCYNLHYWLRDAVYVTALGPPPTHQLSFICLPHIQCYNLNLLKHSLNLLYNYFIVGIFN